MIKERAWKVKKEIPMGRCIEPEVPGIFRLSSIKRAYLK